ncbi:NAD(P)H-dependent oxidoreductase, partial [Staphylococcus epidermidis]|uniref:NAD(P)H-dependent oxidoreductase n=1 Tax=Staphylococcus epidermidis TaxID=1282 RepID=UPI0016426006
QHDLHVEIFHLPHKPIHQFHFPPTTQPLHQIKNNLKSLQNKPIQPHFLILPTPNYHPSFSPILKNPLHHLNIHHFKIKPLPLISNS